jgi:ABC-type phosphate/phosphonate transport system substrate-binding protein
MSAAGPHGQHARADHGWRLALPMYNNSPALTEAARALLRRVMQGLRARGWAEPMALAEPGSDDLPAFWRAPDTLLSQTCGYPLITQLAGDVDVLARPGFAIDGCEDHSYCSLIVVRDDDALANLADLQGQRLAVNSPDSHSGMNALRHRLAPVAAPRLKDGRFFAQVLLSGSHADSLALVQTRQADVCAVDCVTFAQLAAHRPEAVYGLRVLARTEQAPSLPWICNRHLGAEQRAQLLALVMDLPQSEPVACATLRLQSFKSTTLADYEPIAEMEEDAVRLGYPVLR